MSARVRALFAGSLFRRLLATRAVSQLGDGMFQLATASILLFENPGPNPALDLLIITAVTLIPFSALGPFAGVFIDRWDRRMILTLVPLARAAAAVAVALTTERSIGFYLLVLTVLSANRFFLATLSAELPRSVPGDALLTANAVQTTGGSISNVLGQGAGALVAGAIGGLRTALIAGVAFATVGLIARGIPTHRAHATPSGTFLDDVVRVTREMIEGAQVVWRNTRVRRALTAITGVQVGVGVMVGVLIHYFIATLRLEVEQAFAILAFLAAGIGVGVIAVPVIGRRVRPDQIVPLGYAVAASACAATAAMLSRSALVFAGFAVGFAYALAKIPVDTIVQEEIADARRGRAFALYDMLFNVARVAGVGIAAAAFASGAAPVPIVGWTAAGFAACGVALSFWRAGPQVRSA